MKILFVCTGNSCRSPMAHAMAQDIIGRLGHEIKADSAGIYPGAGSASPHAQKIMAEMGLDLSNHKTASVNDYNMDEYHLILTMTQAHKNHIAALLGDVDEKLYTLGEYIGVDGDISDPFGGDEEEYRQCAMQIKSLLELAIPKIVEK